MKTQSVPQTKCLCFGPADNVIFGKFYFQFLSLFFLLISICCSTPTEAECIFHEMLHKWNICNNTKIPCPICDRLFSKSSLRCHLRLHTNERLFSCTTCPLKFTRKANLKEHIQRIHIKTPTVKSRKRRLKRTSSTQHNDYYVCTICEKNFHKK